MQQSRRSLQNGNVGTMLGPQSSPGPFICDRDNNTYFRGPYEGYGLDLKDSTLFCLCSLIPPRSSRERNRRKFWPCWPWSSRGRLGVQPHVMAYPTSPSHGANVEQSISLPCSHHRPPIRPLRGVAVFLSLYSVLSLAMRYAFLLAFFIALAGRGMPPTLDGMISVILTVIGCPPSSAGFGDHYWCSEHHRRPVSRNQRFHLGCRCACPSPSRLRPLNEEYLSSSAKSSAVGVRRLLR